MLRQWQRTNGERGKRSVTLSSFGGSNPPLSTNTLIIFAKWFIVINHNTVGTTEINACGEASYTLSEILMQVVSMKQEASSFRWEQFTLLITLVGGGSVKDVLPPLSVLYGFILILSTNNNIWFDLRGSPMRYERFLHWNDIIYHQKKNNALERKFEGWRIGIKKNRLSITDNRFWKV